MFPEPTELRLIGNSIESIWTPKYKSNTLTSLETTKQWSRWSIKGRSPTMRHVSRTHRVALDGLFNRINLDPKIQIKYIDNKNQFADILAKGNFTRDEWNHLLCLFNIIYFSSTNCLEVMSKRTQQDVGEERVTTKSKPMMNLVSRYRVRDPNVFASTASERLENTKSECQNVPLSSLNEQQTRTERPVLGASSSNCSEWYLAKSGLLKCGNLVKCRTQVLWDPFLTSLSSMVIWTLTPPQNRTFLQDHDHPWTE